jgi:ABC-type glycerol-3-phosphate transport system substrate-binding protein
MKSKYTISILTILLATTMVAGFGCKGLSVTEKQAVKPVTLEYWTVYDDVDELQKLVAQYRATRSYLTINIRQIRPEEVYSRLTEALAEDKGPDIISLQNRWLPAFESKLSPMPASVKDATMITVSKKLGTETVVTINDVALPNILQLDKEYVKTVKKDVVRNGKIYGLPLSLDLMALYYNKDLLDKAGIAEAPKDWKEFQSAVKKLTKYDKDGKIIQSGTALGVGSNVPGFDDLFFILLKQSGLEMVDGNGYAIFNTGSDLTQTASVINFLSDYANSARDTYSWNEKMSNALDQFGNGSLAFFFGYSYHLPTIKARAPQLNIEVIPMLQLSANTDKQINAANYWVQSVVKKSSHQSEAWAFINYLARSSANKTYLDNTGRPSALRAYITEQSKKTELAPFAAQALVAENWYYGKDYSSAQKALADLFTNWLTTPVGIDQAKWHIQILNNTVAKINQTL